MKKFKGIILSGGTGSRLFPVTKSISKQLLSIYNKPMIYYSLSILMMMDIREILIITRPDEKKLYQKLLKSGKEFGVKFKYISQKKPNGIAQSFLLGKKFIDTDNVALILGDNFFYSNKLEKTLLNAIKKNQKGASVFICKSKNPKEFGVVELSPGNKIKKIIEKPKKPKSKYIVTGLYLYDNKVVKLTRKLNFSKRGELEITDLNNLYLKQNMLKGIKMENDINWMDNGNCDSLLKTANFVKKIELQKKSMILCPEQIAFKKRWIKKEDLIKQAQSLKNTEYGKHLLKLAKNNANH